MTELRAKCPAARVLAHVAFALALLALTARVIQLARVPADRTTSTPVAPGSLELTSESSVESSLSKLAGSSVGAGSAENSQVVETAVNDQLAELGSAELAEVYAHCPMASAVDWKTPAASPGQAGAILPPCRETAERVPGAPIEPAVPRIRYPVAVRIASLPKDTAAPVTESKSFAANDDWLIDPGEWFTPEERTRRDSQQAPPAGGSPAHTEPAREPNAPAAPGSAGGFQGGPIAPSEPKSAEGLDGSGTVSSVPPPAEPGAAVPTQESPSRQLELTLPSEPPPQVPNPDEPLPAPQATDLFAPPAQEVPANESTTTPLPQPAHGPSATVPRTTPGVDPHLELFAKNAYPSARECATCHEDIYHEWSISAHAYAAVSPMFHKFEQKLNDLSQGTVGYFCMRCHAPVATALCESRAEPLWNMPEVAREGITCVACHRVQYIYGKSNGERRIEPGDMFGPVLGGIGGDGIAEVIQHKDEYKVKTSPNEQGPGQEMHLAGIYFEPLTKSEFCTPCHQVAVHPGIKLEVVWEQYRASPAYKKGIQCQDCHMGRVPGLPLGYNCGPVAKVADKTVNHQRKRSNHVFYGPNYSIAHPGIFPFHLKANRWTMQDWLAFDWRAGWGTEEFEKQVDAGQIRPVFPPVWAEADDRYDAREIIDENIKKLNHKRELRVQVMENGSHVDGPFFESPRCRGEDLHFHFLVTNTNEGHNLLTASLGAQPQLWANIVLIGPDGRRVWETGYTDSFGDLANIHSHDVRHKKIPYDWQLFNLQSMFLITGAKGTDREFYVPVNVDSDQLPFIRPGTQPISVLNHPPFIRMESQSLAPLGSRRVPYLIPGQLLQQPGTYRLSFRMRSRAEPIYFMQFCGATEEMQRSMNEWMIDVHPVSVEFTIP